MTPTITRSLPALALAPRERLERAVRDAAALRAARAQATRTTAEGPLDVLRVLWALEQAGVQYVLIGELAEVLHGSPLLPVSGRLEIVPRAGQRERLGAAIAAAGGRAPDPAPERTVAIDAPSSFPLAVPGTELVVNPAPPGTHGYEDLRHDLNTVRLEEDLDATVASLIDLVRIAEASEDRARVPALRRTLELAAPSLVARAA